MNRGSKVRSDHLDRSGDRGSWRSRAPACTSTSQVRSSAPAPAVTGRVGELRLAGLLRLLEGGVVRVQVATRATATDRDRTVRPGIGKITHAVSSHALREGELLGGISPSKGHTRLAARPTTGVAPCSGRLDRWRSRLTSRCSWWFRHSRCLVSISLGTPPSRLPGPTAPPPAPRGDRPDLAAVVAHVRLPPRPLPNVRCSVGSSARCPWFLALLVVLWRRTCATPAPTRPSSELYKSKGFGNVALKTPGGETLLKPSMVHPGRVGATAVLG